MTAATAAQGLSDPLNEHVANMLDETARLLEEQRANVFRVQAYRNAADTVRALRSGVDDILDAEGLAGLDQLPGIGQTLARVIDQIVTTGRFPMLERLRGGSNPMAQQRLAPSKAGGWCGGERWSVSGTIESAIDRQASQGFADGK